MTERALLITGASRGLGAATARRAAAAGYRLALVARSAESLEPLVAELGAGRTLALAADVTEWSQISAAAQTAEERFGRLDAAFANAGQMLPVSFFGNGGTDPEKWRDMVLTNVYGAAITARAVLPALARTRGHLVLTGSVAGRHIRRANLYSATKWAVTGLAGSIREEAVGTGVRVTLLQPGVVDTDLIYDEMRELPLLDPDDIARAVCYALDQPPTVDVNEIVLRPTGQKL
ncbi:SDR family NAD(P)-dependent oxidoreductase [Amycolatopsis acidiphila]|uniref:SDR family NAD(P)-dependent oxidoreductase n=1 Tax=Amycolatopsis acidiphila TaxID=715473 RepID=A0A558A756_9PSEU|nr:SDR family NAD(P)-dependent oxidoreductase [Amycolatopsis acidiphila]TVT20095.1 SDR family NAD(P)-dependent oxidoreductase [Amycolatopsis acidiphila]UIJ62886.1 SDR family NAD(P)-dependent oxidoreductase [Amycolatopsis acidiphila]GHG64825.1 short-chain dehydrogenase [Amycolatopsis acidiphila]